MTKVIKDFKRRNEPVICVRHTDKVEESPLVSDSEGAQFYPEFLRYADHLVEKHTPSSFFETSLHDLLQALDVDHITIIGFNTEFCCQFTAIAAYDRGYEVTFIENATGTVNDADNYEMPGLDIRDFVGTVLDWSGVIEVLDFEEYEQKYMTQTEV